MADRTTIAVSREEELNFKTWFQNQMIDLAAKYECLRQECICKGCDALPADGHVYSCYCKAKGYVPLYVGTNHKN